MAPTSGQAPTIRASEEGLWAAGEGRSRCAHGDGARGSTLIVFTAVIPANAPLRCQVLPWA